MEAIHKVKYFFVFDKHFFAEEYVIYKYIYKTNCVVEDFEYMNVVRSINY